MAVKGFESRQTPGAGLLRRPAPPHRVRRWAASRDWAGLIFMAPIVVLVVAMVGIPVGRTIYYSLTNYAGLGQPQYTGSANYSELLKDHTFRRVLLNNLLLVLGLIVWVSVPFLLAVMLHGKRFADVMRTLLFVPVLLPPVVVGTAFRIVLSDEGPVNGALHTIGLGAISPGWLTDEHLVLFSVVLVITWAVMGSGVLFYSAGLAAIPSERMEAARIDGAEWRHLVRHVYRPALRHVTRFLVLLLTVSTVTGFFPWIFGLTSGGPGVSSYTLDFDVYQAGIVGGDYGRASAIAVCSIVFLCLMLGAMTVASRIGERLRAKRDFHPLARRRHAAPTRFALARRLPSRPTRRKAARHFRSVLLGLAALAVIFPLAWVVRLAFKPESQWIGDPASIGGGWTFENIQQAWNSGHLGRGLLNSLTVVPLGAMLATVVSALAGFALAKLRVPGRRGLLVATALAVFVPLPAIAIPLFNQSLSVGYADSQPGLSLIYGALFASWGALFMYSYFKDLPDDLIDSARIDGASPIQIFRRIALPLAKPAIVAVFVIDMLVQWNELIVALVMLPDASRQTVTVAIATFSTQFRSGGPLTSAGVLIAACPIILIYAVSQRFMRADLFAGAVKG